MMKRLLIFLTLMLPPFLAGCEKNDYVDKTTFALHYMGISNVHPGETATSSPSYIGETPSGFSIFGINHNGNIFYSPKIDGELTERSTFWVDPVVGTFKLQNSSSLRPGTYKVGISCHSAGVEYAYPEAIVITVIKEK